MIEQHEAQHENQKEKRVLKVTMSFYTFDTCHYVLYIKVTGISYDQISE